MVDHSQEKPGHEQEHHELFENVRELIPVQSRFDAEKAYFQNEQPAEDQQRVLP